MSALKIVGIENSVYGKPQLIKENSEGSLVFEDLPIGITSFNYLLICGFAGYLKTITLRPNLIKDWFFFLFTILVVNSLSYSVLNIFFSIDLNYNNLFINIFFTFIFYIIFANLFLIYQNKFFKENND